MLAWACTPAFDELDEVAVDAVITNLVGRSLSVWEFTSNYHYRGEIYLEI